MPKTDDNHKDLFAKAKNKRHSKRSLCQSRKQKTFLPKLKTGDTLKDLCAKTENRKPLYLRRNQKTIILIFVPKKKSEDSHICISVCQIRKQEIIKIVVQTPKTDDNDKDMRAKAVNRRSLCQSQELETRQKIFVQNPNEDLCAKSGDRHF